MDRSNRQLAPLLADVDCPSFIDRAALDTMSLWLSGAGVRTPTHHDRNGKNICSPGPGKQAGDAGVA